MNLGDLVEVWDENEGSGGILITTGKIASLNPLDDPDMATKCAAMGWTVLVQNTEDPETGYWAAESEVKVLLKARPDNFTSAEECEQWLNSNPEIGLD